MSNAMSNAISNVMSNPYLSSLPSLSTSISLPSLIQPSISSSSSTLGEPKLNRFPSWPPTANDAPSSSSDKKQNIYSQYPPVPDPPPGSKRKQHSEDALNNGTPAKQPRSEQHIPHIPPTPQTPLCDDEQPGMMVEREGREGREGGRERREERPPPPDLRLMEMEGHYNDNHRHGGGGGGDAGLHHELNPRFRPPHRPHFNGPEGVEGMRTFGGGSRFEPPQGGPRFEPPQGGPRFDSMGPPRFDPAWGPGPSGRPPQHPSMHQPHSMRMPMGMQGMRTPGPGFSRRF